MLFFTAFCRFTPTKGSEASPAIDTVIARSQAKSFSSANISPMKNSTVQLQLYGVPYSEHSSFFELTCFALSFDWARMIATVNVGSETSRAKMAKWVEKWEAEKKKRGKVEVVHFRSPEYW
jgi:DNA cross-link repair 1A protein